MSTFQACTFKSLLRFRIIVKLYGGLIEEFQNGIKEHCNHPTASAPECWPVGCEQMIVRS